MIHTMQTTLIKKDLRSVTANKRLFPVLIIVPLVMAILMPTALLLSLALGPMDEKQLQFMLALLPDHLGTSNTRLLLVRMMLNQIIPLFFLIIPIMASSIMAASSFVGEKEKRTLETLLYCPLSLKQIYTAKILASFLLSMLVTLLSFGVLLVVVEIEAWLTMGTLLLPEINWLIILVLVAPAVSFIAITLIVRGSAKALTMEESQQKSAFLLLPILGLIAGQFTGVMMLSPLILLALGILLTIAAWFLVRVASHGFTYEQLLK